MEWVGLERQYRFKCLFCMYRSPRFDSRHHRWTLKAWPGVIPMCKARSKPSFKLGMPPKKEYKIV